MSASPSASPTSASRPRKPAAARRREREAEIVAATRRLFDEGGVRDVQIEDIAKAVELNRAIIYRHFSGKEELFALTLVSYLDDLGLALEAAAAAHDDPTDQLVAVTEAFVDFGLELPAFVDCALTIMRTPGPELLDQISESALFRLGRGISSCLAHLQAVFEDGNAAGVFHVEDPVLLANHLYASGLGALQLARVGMLVREQAPGVPAIAPVSAAEVKRHVVTTAKALATTA